MSKKLMELCVFSSTVNFNTEFISKSVRIVSMSSFDWSTTKQSSIYLQYKVDFLKAVLATTCIFYVAHIKVSKSHI